MTCSESRSIIDWLIVQRQMLGVWLNDIETAKASCDSRLAAKLEEHDKWLARSIDELLSAA